jgi:hypothetical protein
MEWHLIEQEERLYGVVLNNRDNFNLYLYASATLSSEPC